MKKTLTLFLTLLFALSITVSIWAAGSRTEEIKAVYRDIKLVVDGVLITPKDANGSVVEPFIVNGSTYLPVRAVGEALGKTVSWDGETGTVYIGNIPGNDAYLTDVCLPYESQGFNTPDYFTMMGKNYYHGFVFKATTGYALFNLNAEYSSLEFDVGHIDGTKMGVSILTIYLDGEYAQTIELDPEMQVTHITVPLNNALQMKMEIKTDGNGYMQSRSYGFANAIVH